MERTLLKGGSLSGTYLIRDGDEVYVRKEISLTINREFGYQRWYSQLKRLQRYSVMFPGIFPEILRFGSNGDTAWFDMNYIADAVTGQEYLLNASNNAQIDSFLSKLMGLFSTMHEKKIPSSPHGLRLYMQEEVERAIALCLGNAVFRDFQQHKTIIFNGVEVAPISHKLDELLSLAMGNYQNPTETFTHGNSTLENTLFVPKLDRLFFIDPYEETIVDSVFGEYSQILQSSNSYYESYNSLPAVVKGNTVAIELERSANLDYFNEQFLRQIRQKCSDSELIVTRIFEISQFTRMLPFKMAVAPDKLIFFYSLASYLFQELQNDLK